MFTLSGRLRRNAPGRYYVTGECNGCGICAGFAAANFECSDDGSYYFVVQQPYDDGEEQTLLDALEACPMHAIRSDGDDC